MSDNRKYYYLKLKENYFDEDAIVLLESMQDGILYSNILLKLYLKSLKNGGKLQLDENIPYTAQMIATITRQQVGTVERALQIFMKLGLVEPLQNGALYMSNIELLIGQSSTEGERKRRARLALQEQKALPKAGALPTPPCGTGLLRTTTAGTRRPGLPAGMWNTGRICEPTISAACSGAAWEPGKATLRAVSQTPSWRKKSPST